MALTILFSVDGGLELGNRVNGKEISDVPFPTEKEEYLSEWIFRKIAFPFDFKPKFSDFWQNSKHLQKGLDETVHIKQKSLPWCVHQVRPRASRRRFRGLQNCFAHGSEATSTQIRQDTNMAFCEVSRKRRK